MTNHEAPVILTTGDIAKQCGVSFRTVLRWIERGELQAYKLPGRGDHRINLTQYKEFLQKNQMPLPKQYVTTINTVLIAEDDQNMADSMKRILLKNNFTVYIAENGFTVAALLNNITPRIILLDLKMPGLSGFDTIKLIKASNKDIKILVVSAMATAQLKKAVNLGANDYLAKPFTREKLIGKVRLLL